MCISISIILVLHVTRIVSVHSGSKRKRALAFILPRYIHNHFFNAEFNKLWSSYFYLGFLSLPSLASFPSYHVGLKYHKTTGSDILCYHIRSPCNVWLQHQSYFGVHAGKPRNAHKGAEGNWNRLYIHIIDTQCRECDGWKLAVLCFVPAMKTGQAQGRQSLKHILARLLYCCVVVCI